MDKEVEHLRYDCQERFINYRTTENFNKTIEYKYTSWQDETKIDPNIFISTHNIIDVDYSLEVFYDPDAEKEVVEIKKKLLEEGDKICDSVKTFEIFSFQKMRISDICFVNEEKKKKGRVISIIYLIVWAIFFTLGFSSISDLFLIPKKGKASFKFTKIVSGDKRYRANYMENDGISGYDNSMNLRGVDGLKGDGDDKKEMLISLKEYY